MPKEGDPGCLLCSSRCGIQGEKGGHVQTGVLILLYSLQQVSLPWTFRGLGTSTLVYLSQSLLEVHTEGNDAESRCRQQVLSEDPTGAQHALSVHLKMDVLSITSSSLGSGGARPEAI